MTHGKGEREGSAEAAAEDEGLLRAREVEQLLRFPHVKVPIQRLDAAAGFARFAPVVSDAGEVLRHRVERVHLLPLALAALGGPARDYRAKAARREHEEMRPLALDHVVDPDAVQGGDWHGWDFR